MKKERMKMYNDFVQILLDKYMEDPNKSIVFSPYSILSLLAIIADSTAGKTRDEVIRVLGGKKDSGKFIEDLMNTFKELTKEGHFVSSNAVCIEKNMDDKIVKGYKEHLKENFDCELFCSSNMIDERDNGL